MTINGEPGADGPSADGPVDPPARALPSDRGQTPQPPGEPGPAPSGHMAVEFHNHGRAGGGQVWQPPGESGVDPSADAAIDPHNHNRADLASGDQALRRRGEVGDRGPAADRTTCREAVLEHEVLTAWSVLLPGASGPLRFDPADPDQHTDLLYDWLRQPHVAPWWGAERDREQTRAYVERQRGSGHLVPWVVSAPDGTPFGYVETYRAADDPLAAYYPLKPSDRGWHVLVGRPDYLGSGLPRVMGRAVLAYLLAEPGVDRVVCEPNELNARMLNFCRALGYTTLAALDLPDKRALLLACDRAAFAARWPDDLDADGAPAHLVQRSSQPVKLAPKAPKSGGFGANFGSLGHRSSGSGDDPLG